MLVHVISYVKGQHLYIFVKTEHPENRGDLNPHLSCSLLLTSLSLPLALHKHDLRTNVFQLRTAMSMSSAAAPTPAAPAAESLPEGWSSAKDPSTGNTYYYNEAGETTWEVCVRKNVVCGICQPVTCVSGNYVSIHPHAPRRKHVDI